jgi:hypothetical protein
MDCQMDKAKSLGLMEIFMKVHLEMECVMDMENESTWMDQNILVNTLKISLMDKVIINQNYINRIIHMEGRRAL